MKEEIRLMSAGLENGQTLREICPKCGGGSTREKSLSISITETGHLAWFCHRASCGARGKELAWGVVRRSSPKAPRPYTGSLELLDDVQADWLWDRFQISSDTTTDLRYRNAVDDNRIAIPVFGPAGQRRGYDNRAISPALQPKSLIYKELMDEPFMGWYTYDPVVWPIVVEDCFSAAKVWQAGIPSVFLTGTTLSLEKVRELVGCVKGIILALDSDAFPKAIAYAKEYNHLIPIRVWKLNRDLKYEPTKDIILRYFGGE